MDDESRTSIVSADPPIDPPFRQTHNMFALAIPLENLIAFVAKFCDKEPSTGNYIYDEVSFRRMRYKNCYEPFVSKHIMHCKASMRLNIFREPTFASVAKMLRHALAHHSIPFVNAGARGYRAFRLCFL